MSLRRSSGILLHPTSLPGPYGIGELGSHAHRFVDWLAASGQLLWQVMPLGPAGYGAVIPFKVEMLTRAERRFADGADPGAREAFATFERDHAEWLDDYALFMALKDAHGGRPWNAWDEGLRDRHPDTLARARDEHADAVRRHRTWQFWFHVHWG